MTVSYDDVKSILEKIDDPYTGLDLAQSVQTLSVDSGRVRVNLVLGYPAAGVREELSRVAHEALAGEVGDLEVEVEIDWEIRASVPSRSPRTQGVKNVIAVASGKGGVGKSTVALNLALALKSEGAEAALLDGDIYGPSMGKMMGAAATLRPRVIDENTMAPVTLHGIQCMSLAFVMSDDTPAVWRGPMASGAFRQLLQQTRWEDVDYLVVDLPPGTGDIQLTLAQQAAVSGAVIVTTPQDIALLDAVRGIEMFRSVEIPVLGIIENMSVYVCPNCGHEEHLFGTGGGASVAERYETTLLAELPLDGEIRSMADRGLPPVIADPDGPVSRLFRESARKVAAALHRNLVDNPGVIPVVQIQEVD